MRHSIQSLSPGPLALLHERFRPVDGEIATPALRGSFARVHRPGGAAGLVAVAADGTVWYTSASREQEALVAAGFTYSEHNLLAALYFHLPFEGFHRRPLPAPAPRLAPVLPLAAPRPAERRRPVAKESLVA